MKNLISVVLLVLSTSSYPNVKKWSVDLKSDNFDGRKQACTNWIKSGKERGRLLAQLQTILKEGKEPKQLRTTVLCLQEIGSPAKIATERLANLYSRIKKEPANDIQWVYLTEEILETLIRISPEDPRVVEVTLAASEGIRDGHYSILEWLGKLGDKGHHRLCELLTDANKDISARAAMQLMELGARAQGVVDCVTERLEKLESGTLQNTMGYLSFISPLNPKLEPVLRKLSSHPEPNAAAAVARVFQRAFPLGPKESFQKWAKARPFTTYDETILLVGHPGNDPKSGTFRVRVNEKTGTQMKEYVQGKERLKAGSKIFVLSPNGVDPGRVRSLELKGSILTIKVGTERDLPANVTLLLSTRSFPIQSWQVIPSEASDGVLARKAYFEGAQTSYTPEAAKNEEHWACKWYRPGLTELPTDVKLDAHLLRLKAENKTYVLASIPDCSLGEYVTSTAVLIDPLSNVKLAVSPADGSAAPLADLDGDGFPEFLGSEPVGGGEIPKVFAFYPKPQVLHVDPDL